MKIINVLLCALVLLSFASCKPKHVKSRDVPLPPVKWNTQSKATIWAYKAAITTSPLSSSLTMNKRLGGLGNRELFPNFSILPNYLNPPKDHNIISILPRVL